MVTAAAGATQLVTSRVDGTGRYYLGRLGHIPDLKYSDSMPGGADQLTCTLQADPSWRHESLDPGRRLLAIRGASIAWEGSLTKPVPSDNGWAITGSGSGNWGSSYRANWSTAWTAAAVLDAAISRGLRWIRGSIAAGTYLTEIHDSGSLSVTEFLNLITSPGSLTWRVRRTPGGLELDVIPIPATPTRLLISNIPAARTIAGGFINSLWVRYQATADSATIPATYDLNSADDVYSIAKHDRLEEYWDISTAGVLDPGSSGALAVAALNKYTAASWADSFDVAPGQYLTMGGVPVDLGCENAGEVARLILADGPYGGEIGPAPPVTFPVGRIDYNDATGGAQITPFQSSIADWSTLLSVLAPKAPA